MSGERLDARLAHGRWKGIVNEKWESSRTTRDEQKKGVPRAPRSSSGLSIYGRFLGEPFDSSRTAKLKSTRTYQIRRQTVNRNERRSLGDVTLPTCGRS